MSATPIAPSRANSVTSPSEYGPGGTGTAARTSHIDTPMFMPCHGPMGPVWTRAESRSIQATFVYLSRPPTWAWATSDDARTIVSVRSNAHYGDALNNAINSAAKMTLEKSQNRTSEADTSKLLGNATQSHGAGTCS